MSERKRRRLTGDEVRRFLDIEAEADSDDGDGDDWSEDDEGQLRSLLAYLYLHTLSSFLCGG